MLTDLCQELHNWFELEKHPGEYTIEEGVLSASFLQEGQYFRIIGSVFNDGVWQYGVDQLTDETFDGSVWALGIPKAVVELDQEITAWQTKYGEAAIGPYSSESFGGYSYTKATSSSGGGITWQEAFKLRLNRWRKMQ